MHRFQAHRAYLYDLGVHVVLNHFIQKSSLIPEPQVCQTDHSQSLAAVFDPQSLVITEYSTSSNSLYLWITFLDFHEQLKEILHLVNTILLLFFILLIVHLLVECLTTNLSSNDWDVKALSNKWHNLNADGLIHEGICLPALSVSLCLRVQVGNAHQFMPQ